VTLVSSLASSGQTTFSGTLGCAEVAQALSIDVGDHPNHSLGTFQTKCTWVKPIEIRSVRSTAYTGTATLETQDSISRLRGYGVIRFADGNSATFRFSGTSVQHEGSVTAQGTWTFVEGTGDAFFSAGATGALRAVVPASELREEATRKESVPSSKPEPVVVKAPRRDFPPEPAPKVEKQAKRATVTFPETDGTPSRPAKVTVVPDTGLVGKVASVNASLHFVVLNFPVGRMAAVDQQLGLYREGQKIGDVKITGPQQDDNIIADIISGEAQAGDEVREK